MAADFRFMLVINRKI